MILYIIFNNLINEGIILFVFWVIQRVFDFLIGSYLGLAFAHTLIITLGANFPFSQNLHLGLI